MHVQLNPQFIHRLYRFIVYRTVITQTLHSNKSKGTTGLLLYNSRIKKVFVPITYYQIKA